jgi:hypothetical protein
MRLGVNIANGFKALFAIIGVADSCSDLDFLRSSSVPE